MALTLQQKKIMRKALCAGWYRSEAYRKQDSGVYRVTPDDLNNLAQLSDAEVLAIVDAYKAWKLAHNQSQLDAINTGVSSIQAEITDLNS